jgi:clan AA aspartic protease (TIGR02281 family)
MTPKIIVLAVVVASALPAFAFANVSQCGDLRRTLDSVGAKYNAERTHIGQFKRSHGMPLGGGDNLAQYTLSIEDLTSYGNMLRDEFRNSRELVALAKSEMDNGCLNPQTKEGVRRWLASVAGWMQTTASAVTWVDARLAQTPGGASPSKPRFAAPSFSPPTGASGETVVKLVSEGGTFRVPVAINGQLTLNFVVDSGAADVSIPADVVMTLWRTGSIAEDDFLDSRTYRMADGSTIPSQRFRIRSLKVGDNVLENVTGSIAPAAGDLLLGQSFLSRFKSWSIDNQRRALVLN